MSDKDARERFEAYMLNVHMHLPQDLRRRENGNYWSGEMQQDWELWQAATVAAESQRTQAPSEQLTEFVNEIIEAYIWQSRPKRGDFLSKGIPTEATLRTDLTGLVRQFVASLAAGTQAQAAQSDKISALKKVSDRAPFDGRCCPATYEEGWNDAIDAVLKSLGAPVEALEGKP